jgi:hypothetical protein
VPTSTFVSLIAVACLVTVAAWVSLHALGTADPSLVPARARPRIAWCLRHHRQLYMLCLMLVVFVAVTPAVIGVHG